MAIKNSQPSSLNYIHPNNFTFRVKRLPDLNFTVQSINVPGISVGRVHRVVKEWQPILET